MHLEAPVGRGIDIVISTAPPSRELILYADNEPYITKSQVNPQSMDDPCCIALSDVENEYKMTVTFTRKEYEKFIKQLYQNVKRDKRKRKKEKKLFKKSQSEALGFGFNSNLYAKTNKEESK